MKKPFYVAANNHDTRQLFIHKVWARNAKHAGRIVERARPYATVIEAMIPADFELWMNCLKKETKEESDAEMIDFINQARGNAGV